MRAAHGIDLNNCGRFHELPVDARIGLLADAQNGAVARWQLLAADLTKREIDWRVARGRLLVVHRGVYAVGHRLAADGMRTAAALAGGPGAVVAHRTGAGVQELLTDGGALWHVLVPGSPGRARPGIRFHATVRLHPEDVEIVRGIPVTTVERTLLDLMTTEPEHEVRRALDAADRNRSLDMGTLRATVGRSPRHPGRGILRLAETHVYGTASPDSPLAAEVLAAVIEHGLERPETDAWVRGASGAMYRGDLVWRAARVIVEADGRPDHASLRGFEEDRARDADLLAAGWRIVRVTSARLRAHRRRVLGEIAAVLGT